MSESILAARDLTRHYQVSRGFMKPEATVQALNGVSFEVHPGRTLAVVGESGCGKSTLARQLTLIETPTAGSLVIEGNDTAGLEGKALKQFRTRVQMVFQNPYGSLNPRKSIGATLEEPLVINTGLSKSERRDKVQAILARVGLRPEHHRRYPHMFSGGQRQRIAIARAMMLDPGVIVADEPTSALDVSIQAQILNLFMDLQDETGVAYVFISHNLSVVEHIADDIMVMYLGCAVEYGDSDVIFSNPLHPYTIALMSSTPSVDPARRRKKIRITGELPSPINPPSGCTFHKRCPYATERCVQEVPRLRELEGRHVACHHAGALDG